MGLVNRLWYVHPNALQNTSKLFTSTVQQRRCLRWIMTCRRCSIVTKKKQKRDWFVVSEWEWESSSLNWAHDHFGLMFGWFEKFIFALDLDIWVIAKCVCVSPKRMNSWKIIEGHCQKAVKKKFIVFVNQFPAWEQNAQGSIHCKDPCMCQ